MLHCPCSVLLMQARLSVVMTSSRCFAAASSSLYPLPDRMLQLLLRVSLRSGSLRDWMIPTSFERCSLFDQGHEQTGAL